jgi:hypothetical protein
VHGEGLLAWTTAPRLVERRADQVAPEYDQGGARQCPGQRTRADVNYALVCLLLAEEAKDYSVVN